jgi:hypothetical protein
MIMAIYLQHTQLADVIWIPKHPVHCSEHCDNGMLMQHAIHDMNGMLHQHAMHIVQAAKQFKTRKSYWEIRPCPQCCCHNKVTVVSSQQLLLPLMTLCKSQVQRCTLCCTATARTAYPAALVIMQSKQATGPARAIMLMLIQPKATDSAAKATKHADVRLAKSQPELSMLMRTTPTATEHPQTPPPQMC